MNLKQFNLIFAIGLLTITARATESPPFRIVIDPGHGGIDRGAQRKNLVEAEISLLISRKLQQKMNAQPGFKAVLTRDADVALTLQQRAESANRKKADLFISIHANSSEDPRAEGAEFYFQNQMPADEEAMFIANRENNTPANEAESDQGAPRGKLTSQSDVKRIIEDLRRNNRVAKSFELSKALLESWPKDRMGKRHGHVIRQAPFYVIANTDVPAVLIEVGFLTHASEGPRLGQANYQTEIAEKIYAGILRFKEVSDKDAEPRVD